MAVRNLMGRSASVGPKQGIYEQSETLKHVLGERLELYDGRVFYYAKASGGLTAGQLLCHSPTLNAEDTVTVAHAINTTSVTVTAAATVTANQFAQGFLVVDEGTGVGDFYKVKSNTGAASASTFTVELYDGLVTAWAIADTDISLYTNPFSALITSPTDGIALPAGVSYIDVTTLYYFWVQTWGWAPMYINGTTNQLGNLITERLLAISGTAGAADVYTAIGAGSAIIGECIMDSADYEDVKYQVIMLKCHR